MKYLIHVVLTSGALIGMMCLQPAFAEELMRPGGAQSPSAMKFSERGKIDSVNVKEDRIVLNGRSYRLSRGTRVYGPKGGLIPREALRKGIFVSFNTSVQGSSYIVSEIWIIPVN